MIRKPLIEKVQKEWGDGIVKIGSLRNDRKACEKAVDEFLDKLYAFDLVDVLFKPTLASVIQFRLTKEAAKSYFIGGNPNFPEDRGFAINPWTNIRFENIGFVFEVNIAMAMGNYFLTDLKREITKVEYTMGFIRDPYDQLKISLHHSSLPYKPNN